VSSEGSKPVRIGLLGRGTVGGAFVDLLAERADAVTSATGRRPEIAGVLTREVELAWTAEQRRQRAQAQLAQVDEVEDQAVAFALGEPIQPRTPDGPGDMDDELRRSRGRLGNERLRRLLGGSTRAGQRAPGHGQQRERGCREDERPSARHGQGGHVSSLPGEQSRRVDASATNVCQFAARRRS